MSDPGDADGIDEAQHLLQAMQARLRRNAARQRTPPQRAAPAAVDRPDMPPPRNQRKGGRAVAALGRYREVVALEEPQRERKAPPDAGPRPAW